MAVYRDHRRRGAALIAHVAYVTACSVAGGSGAVFLLILIAALVGEEAFAVPFGDALDPIFRLSIGVVALVLGLAGLVATFALGARRTLTAQQLAEDAATEPGSVATWADRRDVELASPFRPAYIFAAYFLILDVIALIVLALALSETARHNPESAAEGMLVLDAAAALAVTVVLLVILASRIGTPRWREAAEQVGAIWNPDVRAAATRAERDARPSVQAVGFGTAHRILSRTGKWLERAAIPVGGAGLALFLAGVFLRQPCRGCDPLSYDPPIERLIDMVVVVGGPLLMLSAAIGILGLAADWTSSVSETVQLRRRALDHAPSPTAPQLLPHLVEQGPAELLGIALVAASFPLVAPFAAALVVNGDPSFGTVIAILAVVGVLGVAVLVWSVGVDDRVRNLMREAWSPGDPVPPGPDVRRRTAPTRDAGDDAARAE